MVIVAQLVRAPDCGSGGRGFEPRLSPFKKALSYDGAFLISASIHWDRRIINYLK